MDTDISTVDAEDDPDAQAEFAAWWAHVPDFVKPDYPLDIPPARLPFVTTVFSQVGAAEHCPAARCRRARSCQGGNGPPCYRADRAALQQVLFLYWSMLFIGLTSAEYGEALRSTGNRYAPDGPGPAPVAPEPASPQAAAGRQRAKARG